jgi:hypothetical protein
MSQGGSIGGRSDIGGSQVASPWDPGSTVSFASINGPRAGGDTATGAASRAVGTFNSGKTLFGLEIPTLIVLGVLVWLVLEKLDE